MIIKILHTTEILTNKVSVKVYLKDSRLERILGKTHQRAAFAANELEAETKQSR